MVDGTSRGGFRLYRDFPKEKRRGVRWGFFGRARAIGIIKERSATLVKFIHFEGGDEGDREKHLLPFNSKRSAADIGR